MRPDADGNGIRDLRSLLGWMTNDESFTYQLPRFSQECKPWLLRYFPSLCSANIDEADQRLTAFIEADGELGIDPWWKSLGLEEFYDVPRIPWAYHVPKNAYEL